MKIIYYTYPWAMDTPGGGERQLMAYREHLARNGIEARLFNMWEPDFNDADIFHCFSVMPGVVEICDYAKKHGLKLVVSPNLWVTKETQHLYPHDTIWSLFELADTIIVNSNMELHALSSLYGFHESKFRVVYNAADTDFLVREDPALFRKAHGIDGGYVLNIANIEPRKNQLRFMEILQQERSDLTLVIAGHTRDPIYLKKCQEIGKDRLKIVAALPYASPMLRSAIAGCDFFAMPSTLETPSIAALEAAATGAKILITDQGSTTEYFQQSVTYVDPASNEALASGIHAASSATAEYSTWAARNNFLWPKVIPSLINAYQDTISRN